MCVRDWVHVALVRECSMSECGDAYLCECVDGHACWITWASACGYISVHMGV